MTDERLSPAKAADYIAREWHMRVSAETVRRWTVSGSVPATREGGRVLIEPADLRAIFDAQTATERND